MKDFIRKNRLDLGLALAFGIFVLISIILPFPPGISAAKDFVDFFGEFISFIPLMFILVGLFDVWFPKELVERYIGKDAGLKGIFLVILLAMIQAGPLYGAFPVAFLLWKKGCSGRNIFIYLGAFSSFKIPLLTFEISFLGLKFTLLRTLISLPLFILIGFAMEKLLKNADFKVNDPDSINEQGGKR